MERDLAASIPTDHRGDKFELGKGSFPCEDGSRFTFFLTHHPSRHQLYLVWISRGIGVQQIHVPSIDIFSVALPRTDRIYIRPCSPALHITFPL